VGYITVPTETQPPDFADDAYAYLEAKVPGWLPSPGNLEAWLIEALSQLASELAILAVSVPDAIFAYFGDTILHLAPYDATYASAGSSWTMVDAAGYTVYAGTLLALTPPASTDSYTFQTVADFTVPAGQTTVHGITIRALEAGAASSGLSGDLAVLDLDFVAEVDLEQVTEGGTDAETSQAYLNRLSDLLTLMTPRPILPQDFAILVQKSIPAVARAVAIDLYNADTGGTNVPRCVTVVVVGPDGLPCSPETKAQADQLLQSEREVNFLAFIADPTYSSIDVQFTASSYYAFDPNDVAAQVVKNLQTYLNAQTWGLPPFGDTSARSWINDNTVRYLELAQVINQTDGIHYVKTLTLRLAGGSYGSADVVMPGIAPLPVAGTIAGTCTAER
jgi:hypothetical protein